MKKSKSSRYKRNITKCLDILIAILLVIFFSLGGQLLYQYTRYRSFYVSGDSMYPFLNYEATRTNKNTGIIENKNSHDGDWGNYDNCDYAYTCDYGLLDDKDGFLNRIKRFDIVVTYFDSDYSLDNNDLISDSSHEAKIKRIYAFPGESLYFDDDGSFFLKENDNNEFKKIEQNSVIVNDGHLADTNTNSIYATKENPVFLKEGEYFVVGDNRRPGKSRDSRIEGPIGSKHFINENYPMGSYYIRGKVVAILGKTSLEINIDDNGNKIIQNHLVYSSLYFPWAIKEL